jgi:hypothetical protein
MAGETRPKRGGKSDVRKFFCSGRLPRGLVNVVMGARLKDVKYG